MINFTASNTKLLTATVALFAIVGTACGTAATTASPGTDTVAADTAVTATAPAPAVADTPVVTVAEAATTVAAQPAAEAPVPTPAATPQVLVSPRTEVENAAAPVADVEQYLNDDLTSRQLIPASGFAFPCDGYFEETTYPVFPCSTGQLVEDFQSIMNYVDPDFVVDGYFGADTYDAVTGLQASFGMYQTGIIDDVLLEMIDQSIFHDDPEESYDDTSASGDWAVWADEGEGHTITDEQLAELCDSYVPVPGEDINWDLVDDCDAIGIRLVSGD